MAIDIRTEADGKILIVRANDQLTKEDYEQFSPAAERLIDQHGKIRVLFDLHDFHGWKAGALWEDTKFAFKHFRDIERLAVIGEKAWEQGMVMFCRPFTSAQIRYFDRSNAAEAETWMHADLPTIHATT